MSQFSTVWASRAFVEILRTTCSTVTWLMTIRTDPFCGFCSSQRRLRVFRSVAATLLYKERQARKLFFKGVEFRLHIVHFGVGTHKDLFILFTLLLKKFHSCGIKAQEGGLKCPFTTVEFSDSSLQIIISLKHLIT